MEKYIESLKNPLIKQIINLQNKSRERRKTKLFIVEGIREIQMALTSNYELNSLLYCDEFIHTDRLKALTNSLTSTTELIQISSTVYKKLAYRGSTEGVLAIARSKPHDLLSFEKKMSTTPLLLVAEAPEKPGNIGALLRTADAANLDGVILANPKTDLYNPNTIRSSVGCIFSIPIATGSSDEIIRFLNQKNISIYSAILQESACYTEIDYTKSSAIVVGTEDKGLSREWRKASQQNIRIPMQGKIDSMNLSVAAGILIFEAKRQRKFK